MHDPKYGQPERRKRTNLTVREDIMAEARALGLNTSRAAEAGIAAAVKAEKERRWREENAEAIKAYNRRIEQEGMLLPTPWWAEPRDG